MLFLSSYIYALNFSYLIFIVQLCAVMYMNLSIWLVSIVVYRERPVINSQTVDLDYLRSLPQGTFGREYVDWLHVNVRNSSVYLF